MNFTRHLGPPLCASLREPSRRTESPLTDERRCGPVGALLLTLQEKLTRMLRDQQNGIESPPANQTVRACLCEWLETTAKPRLRPRTFVGYMKQIEAHIIPALGALRL